MTLENLLTILERTEIPIYHYAAKSFPQLPYIVYTQYNESYRKADNRIEDTIINVQVDLYSEKNDKSYKEIKELLDESYCAFHYTRFADTSKEGQKDVIIHHIFDCEVFENAQ